MNKRTVSTQVDDELAQRLDQIATIEERSRASIIRLALKDYLLDSMQEKLMRQRWRNLDNRIQQEPGNPPGFLLPAGKRGKVMMMKERKWSTVDLGCAASLLARGFKLADVSGEDPLQLTFHFEGNGEEDFLTLEAAYFSGELQVPALSFLQSLNRLKGIIRRARRET